jgi:hypothetical protein
MKKSFFAITAATLVWACSKTGGEPPVPPPACAIAAPVATTVASDSCVAEGKISIQLPTGSGILYSLNNGANQTAPEFSGLLPGTYAVKLTNAAGCTRVDSVLVPGKTITPGPKFLAVKTLFAANCTPCHFGPGHNAGLNLASSCQIANQWERIKARAVDDGTSSPMPQSGLMPLAERQKIVDWIAAGHRITD